MKKKARTSTPKIRYSKHSRRARISESQSGYISSNGRKIPFDSIICGDAVTVLRTFPGECINLIVTSPPYADRRIKTYGGITPDNYVSWFMPIATELKRVLKKDGSFVLNIKEKAENGERCTYVIELILEMRRHGWLWTEEYFWHKRNCYPG